MVIRTERGGSSPKIAGGSGSTGTWSRRGTRGDARNIAPRCSLQGAVLTRSPRGTDASEAHDMILLLQEKRDINQSPH